MTNRAKPDEVHTPAYDDKTLLAFLSPSAKVAKASPQDFTLMKPREKDLG